MLVLMQAARLSEYLFSFQLHTCPAMGTPCSTISATPDALILSPTTLPSTAHTSTSFSVHAPAQNYPSLAGCTPRLRMRCFMQPLLPNCLSFRRRRLAVLLRRPGACQCCQLKLANWAWADCCCSAAGNHSGSSRRRLVGTCTGLTTDRTLSWSARRKGDYTE